MKYESCLYKQKLVRKNSQQTTPKDNRQMENGDRTDGKCRQEGDNSGQYNIEENQVDRIEKERDEESF